MNLVNDGKPAPVGCRFQTEEIYGPYSNPSTLKNSIINANGGVNNLGKLPSN